MGGVSASAVTLVSRTSEAVRGEVGGRRDLDRRQVVAPPGARPTGYPCPRRCSCSPEREPGERRDQLIVIEALAALLLERALRLSDQRVRRRAHLVAQDLLDERGIRRVGRQIALLMARDQLLDLVDVLVASGIEPDLLGLRGRDARQLAHGGERQRPGFERQRERGQLVERERHAQSVLRGARAISEAPLHVLQQRAAADAPPDLDPLGDAKPARFIGIERGTLLREPLQRAVDLAPICRPFHPATHHLHALDSLDHRPRSCSISTVIARRIQTLSGAQCATIRVFSTRKRVYPEMREFATAIEGGRSCVDGNRVVPDSVELRRSEAGLTCH